MFGCGKFDDITMLKYLDKNIAGDLQSEIDSHLRECSLCMNEISEMNRINAVMEAGQADKEFSVIQVTVKMVRGVIEEYFSSIPGRLVPQIQTRGEDSPGELNSSDCLEVDIDETRSSVKIVPVSKESVWIMVESPGLSEEYVELIDRFADVPVYMKKPDSDSLIIKGIRAGNYRLRFDGALVDISVSL